MCETAHGFQYSLRIHRREEAQGPLNCGKPTQWESMRLVGKNQEAFCELTCQDLRDEPLKGWGCSSVVQNLPYMCSL